MCFVFNRGRCCLVAAVCIVCAVRFRWNDCLVLRQWCLPLTKQHCWCERCCFTFVCARSLPIRLFVHLCFPFAVAYLDVSFFYHILFRLGNFFWLMWCGSIDADVRTIHWCLEFSRIISLTFILFSSFLSECETSRLPSHATYTVCMIFPLALHIYIYSSRGFRCINNNIICKQFLWANDSNFFLSRCVCVSLFSPQPLSV